MPRGEFKCEGTVGGGERYHRGTVTGCGSCEIGYVINSFLKVCMVQGKLLDVVGGLKNGAGSGNLGLALLNKGRSEIFLKAFQVLRDSSRRFQTLQFLTNIPV